MLVISDADKRYEKVEEVLPVSYVFVGSKSAIGMWDGCRRE